MDESSLKGPSLTDGGTSHLTSLQDGLSHVPSAQCLPSQSSAAAKIFAYNQNNNFQRFFAKLSARGSERQESTGREPATQETVIEPSGAVTQTQNRDSIEYVSAPRIAKNTVVNSTESRSVHQDSLRTYQQDGRSVMTGSQQPETVPSQPVWSGGGMTHQ